jgi:Raf kinase inhibitor-like YbhB/YbcL family protein
VVGIPARSSRRVGQRTNGREPYGVLPVECVALRQSRMAPMGALDVEGGHAMRAAILVLVLSLAACSHGGATSSDQGSTQSTQQNAMELTSPAFADDGTIPDLYTCEGENISPPLEIHNVPADTVSLALLVVDPEAMSAPWDHWIVYDIEPVNTIPEGVESLGTTGTNSWGRTDYGGPCPDLGVHRYSFTVIALDTTLGLAPGASKSDVLAAADGHVLAEATLTGRYGR